MISKKALQSLLDGKRVIRSGKGYCTQGFQLGDDDILRACHDTDKFTDLHECKGQGLDILFTIMGGKWKTVD